MDKKITKQQLATKIWEAANNLRRNLEAHEYKDYILSLILYKYLSDKQTELLFEGGIDKDDLKYFDNQLDLNSIDFEKTKSLQNKEEIESIKKNFIDQNGYFIQYRNLFNTWLHEENKNNFDIKLFRDAFTEFNKTINEKYKVLFEDVFLKFETGLGKLGTTTQDQNTTVNKLIEIISEIPTRKQEYDVLGFIYEYLIARFASTAGKKSGEFYTPHEVSVLMSKIIAFYLKDREKIKIYDPTSGSGSLLLNIGQEFKKYKENADLNPVTYYAQEIKDDAYNLTKMNLIMKDINIADINVRKGDTLEDDWPIFKNNDPSQYEFLAVDAVVSNPPYSQKWESENWKSDPRYAEYGIAPKSKADYAFLLHDLYHLEPNGIMAIVLPHGVLFRGNSEKQIRETLVKKGQIDTIIGLPANMFYGTSIPTIIMVLKKQRTGRDIFFVDASQLYIKDGKNNKFSHSHIKKISDIVNNKIEVSNLSRLVSYEEIKQNDFNLNISRYIDNFKKPEEYDLYSSMFGGISLEEMAKYDQFFATFPQIKNKIFSLNANDYYQIINNENDNIRQIILEDNDIKQYLNKYEMNANLLVNHIKQIIPSFKNMLNDKKPDIEENLSDFIFNDFEKIELLDIYDIYQIIVNNVDKITNDLELIYSYNEANKNITHKDILENEYERTKSGKNAKIVDWKSDFISRQLIEDLYFKDKHKALNQFESDLENLNAQLDEACKLIEEDEKNEDIYDFEKDQFKDNQISVLAKSFLKEKINFDDDSFEKRIINMATILNEISTLKKQKINPLKNELIDLSLEKYLSLSEEEIYDVLIAKWTKDLVEQIKQKGMDIINDYVSKFEKLSDKYKFTLNDINKQIKDTEAQLANLLSDLKGDESDMQAINELINILEGK